MIRLGGGYPFVVPRGLPRVAMPAALAAALIVLASCQAVTTAAVTSGTSKPGTAAQAAAHPASAACGASGGPALAYEQVGAMGAATAGSPGPGYAYVKVSCGSGVTTTIAKDASYVDGPLTWSASGSQLAWWDGSQVTVAAFSGGGASGSSASANSATIRRWACTTCTGVGFMGEQAVAVYLPSAGYPPVTQLLEYPQSGSGQPVARTVTGLPHVSHGGSNTAFGVSLLGSLPAGGIVVNLVSATEPYTPAELFYRIDAAGHATEYGTGTAGTSTLTGIGNFAVNAAGTQFAFAADSGCRNYHHGDQGVNTPSLLDPTTGTVATPATPAGGGTFGYWVEGTWFDPAGTPHVSLLKNLSDCASNVALWPPGSAPVDCTLAGGHWVTTGSGVLQEEYGPGAWAAETTGALPAAGSPSAFPLTVLDGSSVRARASDVITFAWAP